jgi:hypothetical protein
MSKRKRIGSSIAAMAAALALAGLVVASAGASKVVTISSTIQVGPFGNIGKVKSPNSGCVSSRKVVLKQKGYGALGKATTDDQGKWEVPIESIKYKGGLPYKVYAEVKPLSQGTAGTIYKCLGATSKIRTINGG